jgi:hypothetical protein
MFCGIPKDSLRLLITEYPALMSRTPSSVETGAAAMIPFAMAAADQDRFDLQSLLLEKAAHERHAKRNLAVPGETDKHHPQVLLLLRERRLDDPEKQKERNEQTLVT